MSDQVQSLWSATAPKLEGLYCLSGFEEVDVVIVGAGFTGLSAALSLAQQGKSVAVLESQSVGFGGSGRNVGLVNAGLWLPPETIEKQLGLERARALNSVLAQAPETVFSLIKEHCIACEATRQGTLHLAVGKAGRKDIENRARQLIDRGAPVALLNASDTAQRTGSEYFSGALFDPRAGTIQPLAYARGLAKAAMAAGVKIYEKTPVLSLQKQGRLWSLQCPNTASVSARNVILATNAYSGELQKALPASITPIQYSQFASEPLTTSQLMEVFPNKEGAWDTCTVMSSMRLDEQGRMIFGTMGGFGYGNSLERWANSRIERLFPQLGKLSWEYAWTGKIAFSEDHLPHFHELAEGVFSVIGYSGRGIGPGTVIGRLVAEYVLGNVHNMPLALSAISPVPLRSAKALFYEVGAQAYHLGQEIGLTS